MGARIMINHILSVIGMKYVGSLTVRFCVVGDAVVGNNAVADEFDDDVVTIFVAGESVVRDAAVVGAVFDELVVWYKVVGDLVAGDTVVGDFVVGMVVVGDSVVGNAVVGSFVIAVMLFL